MAGTIYAFGDIELDLGRHELRRRGQAVDVQKMPFELLTLLLEKEGQLATRQEIIQRVWGPDVVVVTDQSINTTVRKLRLALGDDPDRPQFVQTVTGKGYRFIAPVRVIEGAPAAAARVGAAGPSTTASLPAVASSDAHVDEAADDDVNRATPAAAAGARRPRHVPRYGPLLAGGGLVLAAAALILAVTVWTPRRSRADVPAGKIMLAILPLENLTGSEEHQYIVDGLHEEIISRLGRLQPERLGVIARTSTLQYRGTTKSIASIGRELSAQYVLEGSVRRAGRRLRVTGQLIQVSDQTHLWAETIERELDDLFQLQVEIGARVAESLAVDVLPEALARTSGDAQLGPQARAAYMRGKYFLQRRALDNPANAERAVEQFRRVLEAAPRHAEAHAELGHAYWHLGVYGDRRLRGEFSTKAVAALETALALDPRSASARLGLALIQKDRWNVPAAERNLREAIALDPNSALAHQHLSRLLAYIGRYQEAVSEIRIAEELDPLDPDVHDAAFYIHLAGRRWERAEMAVEKLNELAPGPGTRGVAAALLALRGDCPGALRMLPDADELVAEPDAAANDYPASYALGRCLPPSVIKAFTGRLESRGQPYAYTMAALYAGAGDRVAGLRWIEKAFDDGEVTLIFAHVDPMLDSLRTEPRFRRLLAKMRLPVPEARLAEAHDEAVLRRDDNAPARHGR